MGSEQSSSYISYSVGFSALEERWKKIVLFPGRICNHFSCYFGSFFLLCTMKAHRVSLSLNTPNFQVQGLRNALTNGNTHTFTRKHICWVNKATFNHPRIDINSRNSTQFSKYIGFINVVCVQILKNSKELHISFHKNETFLLHIPPTYYLRDITPKKKTVNKWFRDFLFNDNLIFE